MKEEKSWIGWFIEDWGKYSHALTFVLFIPYFSNTLISIYST